MIEVWIFTLYIQFLHIFIFIPIILFRAKLFLLFSPLFVCCLNNFLFYLLITLLTLPLREILFYRYSIELFKVLCWYMNILSPYPFPIQFAYLNFFRRKFYSHVVSQDKFSLESWCILKCKNKKTQFLHLRSLKFYLFEFIAWNISLYQNQLGITL